MVREQIKQGKLVLFTGTACQIAALNSFLGKLNKKNLITLDVLCHGVASKKVVEEYIKSKEEEYGKEIIDFRFRVKEGKEGWEAGSGTRMKLFFVDGTSVTQDKYTDAYFDYKLGTLEYRSVRFETELLEQPNFQGNAAVNYTDRETPWTRIIEHKWFEFGKDVAGNELPKTVISREYSSEWKPGDEPYYPVNDDKNSKLYNEYKKMADREEKTIFGGRLGEYKYYDMDATIDSVLNMCEKEFGDR